MPVTGCWRHGVFTQPGAYRDFFFQAATTMKNVLVVALLPFWLLTACSPTVQLALPKEPITINLNVHIEHEIRIKVDKELDDVFAKNSNLF